MQSYLRKAVTFSLAVVIATGMGITVTEDWGKTSLTVGMLEAEARRGGGGGFSSGRSSMSSFRSSSRSSSSASRSTYKPKTKTYKAPAKAKPKAKPPAFAKAGQRATAKQAAKKSNSSFKKPVTASTRTTTLASTTPATQTRLRNVDRSTYYSNRTTTMNRYSANSGVSQTVILRGSSSYGVYDSWFFWHVAMSDPYYGYNHYRDPSYIAWKREARSLSADNAELRAQLDAHETTLANATGDRNANYLPEGITEDVIFAPAYVEATKPILKLCTGRNDGKYAQAGLQYKKVIGDADVQVVMTKGSVQNLDLLASGGCDAAFVQRDAYLGYDENATPLTVTRVGALYNEAVHLFCSKDSGVTHIAELRNRDDISMYVGEAGSGSAVTWANFVLLQDEFTAVAVNTSATDAQFGKGKNDCGIYVGYLKSPFMTTVSKGKNLRMVDIETVPFDEILDPQGKPVYASYEIKEDTYAIQTGWNDTGTWTETPTAVIPVDIIVNDSWKKATANSQRILEQIQGTRSAVVSVL